jgi:hypothetical protein
LGAKHKSAWTRSIQAQSAAERCDAFAHAKQPHAGFEREVAPGLAVVIDGDLDVGAMICSCGLLHAQMKGDPRRLRMFCGVGDGFLCNPVEARREIPRQRAEFA